MTDIERASEWNRNNRDRHNAHTRAWREKNKERQAGYQKAWAAANPEKVRAYARKFYASDHGRAYALAYKSQATPWTRAISDSLVGLFEVLPKAWQRRLAHEILNSNSGQTLCWCNTMLEEYVADLTEPTTDPPRQGGRRIQ